MDRPPVRPDQTVEGEPMTWRDVLLYFVVLLLVLAIIFTFGLQFENTGYGMTRINDLGVVNV